MHGNSHFNSFAYHVKRAPALTIPNSNQSICVHRHLYVTEQSRTFALRTPIWYKPLYGYESSLCPILTSFVHATRAPTHNFGDTEPGSLYRLVNDIVVPEVSTACDDGVVKR